MIKPWFSYILLSMSNLHDLYQNFGVSPWLDNLSRDMIVKGDLARYVENGIRGVTSNPSIFEKAFSGGVYNEAYQILKNQGLSVEEAYWTMAIEDIQKACDELRGVYDSSAGTDGYVSLEVSPSLANDSAGTTEQAKQLWSRVNRPNLMIKIPATEACLASITDCLGTGININVTLIFSLHRYLQVINAYMNGIAKLNDPGTVHSVASFFVSRVDTDIDPLLAESSNAGLAGIAAEAQAQAAYGIFLESFNPISERWAELAGRGANIQRPLWASTSTKDPNYPDLKYVSSLLAKNSVNTLPDATVAAINDHGTFEPSQALDAEKIETAHENLAKLQAAGIDMNQVSARLESQGVAKFQEAFKSMLSSLESSS